MSYLEAGTVLACGQLWSGLGSAVKSWPGTAPAGLARVPNKILAIKVQQGQETRPKLVLNYHGGPGVRSALPYICMDNVQ